MPISRYPLLVTMMIVATSCHLSRSGAPAIEVEEASVRNIVLVIGDGMGPQQVGLLLHYARLAPSSSLDERRTAFDRMITGGMIGISMTYPGTGLVADSAASGSQLATGIFAGSEMIGLDVNGDPVRNIVEAARAAGRSTGIVSDTRITHATPAAFFAHQPQRDLENEIAVDAVNSGVDVLLSGGLRHFLPQEVNEPDSKARLAAEALVGDAVTIRSRRRDDLDLLSAATDEGYELVFDRQGLEEADGPKLLGLFADSGLPFAMDLREATDGAERRVPFLKEMTAKALDVLSRNDDGFFLVVEAGLIDWALHYHDMGATLHELLMLDSTIELILEWMEGRDDTLLVVTGDHETGGFGFSYSGSGIPPATSLPGSRFEGVPFAPLYNYIDPSVLDRISAQKWSYATIFGSLFDSLEESRRTPAALAELIGEHTSFPISEEQAARIIETEPNPYFVEGHPNLGLPEVPRITDFPAFYPSAEDDNRLNLLARETAEATGVVWSTGTHTCTPVLVFATGPRWAISEFARIQHHTDIGRRLIDLVERRARSE